MTSKKDTPANNPDRKHTEKRHIVIYGYTRQELSKVIKHFESTLPDFVKITIDSSSMATRIILTGVDTGLELLRFQMNKYQQQISDLFPEEVVSTDERTIPQVLGDLLLERELTVASAESCTGGNIAHRITEIPGSSHYFLGSVVSYSNDVKANVLGVKRSDISNYGAVSREVVKGMAEGVARLMKSHCAIATSGIAGPDGGTKYKPVGTVWIAAKLNEQVVTECVRFQGSRNEVIQSATNHGMVMLINLLRNSYIMQEDISDD